MKEFYVLFNKIKVKNNFWTAHEQSKLNVRVVTKI